MSDDKKFHVARHDERELFDRDAINRLLDNQYVGHVGFIDQDNQLPFVIPMGLARYRNIRVEPTEEAKAAVYAAYDEYDFTPFDQGGTGEAIRLDEVEVPR